MFSYAYSVGLQEQQQQRFVIPLRCRLYVRHTRFRQPTLHFCVLKRNIGNLAKMAINGHHHSEASQPWFGIDIGGTLTKFVCFEKRCEEDGVAAASDFAVLKNLKETFLASTCYEGCSGLRDKRLQVDNVSLEGVSGNLHFMRFPTQELPKLLDMLARSLHPQETTDLSSDEEKSFRSSIPLNPRIISATGGGSHKFEEVITKKLGVRLRKLDELSSLVRGIEFMESVRCAEVYKLDRRIIEEDPPLDDKGFSEGEVEENKQRFDFSEPYPFLVVNFGSGVSLLAVKGPGKVERVSGSSIGGGSFLGLCALLTNSSSFEEAIALAARGDSRRVDKLVKDIYGGDYERFNLKGSTVASSFAYMSDEARRQAATKADLARAVLVTITNNIGSIALSTALNQGIEKILFVGNFLRANPLALRLLSRSMDFWSEGKVTALFLEHEGYFGAVGCLLDYVETRGEGETDDDVFS